MDTADPIWWMQTGSFGKTHTCTSVCGCMCMCAFSYYQLPARWWTSYHTATQTSGSVTVRKSVCDIPIKWEFACVKCTYPTQTGVCVELAKLAAVCFHMMYMTMWSKTVPQVLYNHSASILISTPQIWGLKKHDRHLQSELTETHRLCSCNLAAESASAAKLIVRRWFFTL